MGVKVKTKEKTKQITNEKEIKSNYHSYKKSIEGI